MIVVADLQSLPSLPVDPGQPPTSAWKVRNDGVKAWWLDATPGGVRNLHKGMGDNMLNLLTA